MRVLVHIAPGDVRRAQPLFDALDLRDIPYWTTATDVEELVKASASDFVVVCVWTRAFAAQPDLVEAAHSFSKKCITFNAIWDRHLDAVLLPEWAAARRYDLAEGGHFLLHLVAALRKLAVGALWTDKRIEALKRYWAQGLSGRQIAEQLGGVTRNAVIAKIHRLGLSGRSASGRSNAYSRPSARRVLHARSKPSPARSEFEASYDSGRSIVKAGEGERVAATGLSPAHMRSQLLGTQAPDTASWSAAPDGRDQVECAIFGPVQMRARETRMFQVFLCQKSKDSFLQARTMAKSLDPDAETRGRRTLEVMLSRGQIVLICLSSADDVVIDEPVQQVIWSGDIAFVQFLITAPAWVAGQPAAPFNLVVRISTGGAFIGRIIASVTPAESSAPTRTLRNGAAKRYSHAFLSYASSDRSEVLKRAQALKAANITFFQDVLSMDAGRRWEAEIYRNIEACDLFLLFWSKAASQSEWVVREAEFALARQRATDAAIPDIIPVLLEGPPPVAPPSSLASIHFNDPILYYLA